jgi:poly(A) polymerase
MARPPSKKHRERVGRAIVERLRAEGHQALYAGGYVRDMLLGRDDPGDIDIATSAKPAQVRKIFRHVIRVGEHYGVLIVVEERIPFEVATFRSDVGSRDGRHPESVVFADARGDAMRRDFTINGMFYNPLTGDVLDHVGGRDDLQARRVRAIGDPATRFGEDYLRLLRAVRFAAQLDFEIDPATWEAMRDCAGGITRIAAERVFQELDRMLLGAAPRRAVELLHGSGLLQHVLPEVSAMAGVPQPPAFHPEGDVLQHTLLTLAHLRSPSRRLAWSALLHDIGKPETFRKTDRIRFNNHHTVGARRARTALERLRAPRSLIEDVYACIENHMNFMNVDKMRLATLKKFLARPTIADEMELHRADCLASHGMMDNYDFLVRRTEELASEGIKPQPLLRGRDLVALGMKPGPAMGALLKQLYDLQLDETLTTREQAVAWLEENGKLGGTAKRSARSRGDAGGRGGRIASKRSE